MSDVLLMCPSVRFVYPLIYQLIYRSINIWILMSLIWNRHGPSLPPLDLCPLIGVSDSLLIYHSGNASWCLLYYLCVPPSARFFRLINQFIDQSIGEYWCMGFEIDTTRSRHRRFVSVDRRLRVSASPLIDWSGNQRMSKLTLLSPVNASLSKSVSVSWLLHSETNKAINRSQCLSECVRCQINWSHYY